MGIKDIVNYLFQKNNVANTSTSNINTSLNLNYERQKQRDYKESLNNQNISLEDVAPFRGKPFSLSGKLLFDCGIPYFLPSKSDKEKIQCDIALIIDKILSTKVFSTYDIGKSITYAQIRVQIYTSTKKIKKHPISVFLNDGNTFYQLYYSQNGTISKAKLTYTPNNGTGYTIDLKEYSVSV